MNRPWLWVLMPMAIQLTNGCAEPVSRLVDFEVLDAETEAGRCFGFLDPEEWTCHIVTVNVTNLDTKSSTSLSSYDWTAFDSDGNEWTDPLVENAQEIGAGQSMITRIGFTTPLGVRLTALEWTGYSSPGVRRSIPE